MEITFITLVILSTMTWLKEKYFVDRLKCFMVDCVKKASASSSLNENPEVKRYFQK